MTRGEQMAEEKNIGIVIQYFAKPQVAAITINEGELKIGDTIRIKGTTTDFQQKVESMQIDRVPVQSARAGQSVGIKVNERVRDHDHVFIVIA